MSDKKKIEAANPPGYETISPISVANYLLRIGSDLSPLKLIKLVYLCHGWHLVFEKKPLLLEKPVAWRYGPVLPSLYYAVRDYGRDAVDALSDEGAAVGSPEPSVRQKEIIGLVYDAYKKYTASQLSKLTHRKDTPWHKTWALKQRNAIVPDELIRDHFLGIWNA